MVKSAGVALIVTGVILLIATIVLAFVRRAFQTAREYALIKKSGHVDSHKAKEKRSGVFEREIKKKSPEKKGVSKEAQSILDEIMQVKNKENSEDDLLDPESEFAEIDSGEDIPKTDILDFDAHSEQGTDVLPMSSIEDDAKGEAYQDTDVLEFINNLRGTDVLPISEAGSEGTAVLPISEMRDA